MDKASKTKTTIRVAEGDTSGPLASSFVNRPGACPAFLGVSIKNKMSNRRALNQLIPWIHAHSSAAKVVVGDYPHRHNLIALQGLTPYAALNKAIDAGRRALRVSQEILSELGADCRVSVCSAVDLIETSECRSINAQLTQYFETGGPFVTDVLNATLEYAVRVRPDVTKSQAMKMLPVLKNYVIEEVAMFLHLYFLGYPVEVYAGPDLPIMKQIATGAYEGFPYQCPQRSHVSISLELDE